MQIIKHRKQVTVTTHWLVFNYTGTSAGFAFPCDAEGNVGELPTAGRANYTACLAGLVNGRAVVACGVETREDTHREPAEGRCNHCRRIVVLFSSWANTCDCGCEYNGSGQELAPRSQWGEETGEQF